jgi:nucleoside-diphosphate-sugar epimerase
MAESHPECRRFYYCSTAYSKGINSFNAEGSGTHIGAEVVNPYQASKWVAELNLEALSKRHSLPVTIFRPSIIVGHETSGWSGSTVFGPYGIMMALHKISKMGFDKYKLDLPRTAVPNCIPVNRVVEAMFGLSSRSAAHEELEFFNCTATSGLSMEEWTKIIERHLNRSIEFGQGQSLGDYFVNKVIRLNRDFIDKTWHFDSTSLAKTIPLQFQPYHLDHKTCEVLVSAFTKELPALSKSFGAGRKRGLADTLRNYAGLNIRYEKVPIKFSDVITILKRLSS